MKTRTLAALVLLAAACNASDKLIVTSDGAAPTGTGGGSAGETRGQGGFGLPPDAAASGGQGGLGLPPDAASASGGQGGFGLPPDAAAVPDAPASSISDAPFGGPGTPVDAAAAGDVASALSCAELPACAFGSQCFCCPLGLRVEHCTCSVACQTDSECPASAPLCNVRKVNGVPLGKGFCTPAAFPCLW